VSPGADTIVAVGLVDLAAAGFASYGEDIRIYELSRITQPEKVRLGSHIVVDDFVFLQGGEGLSIGSYVHIASFSSVTGGGIAKIADFANLSSGARLFSGTDHPDGTGLLGPTVPPELRAMTRGQVVLEEHAFVGANAVVLPGVVLGEGAVLGAGGVATRDLEPWTINVGTPARPVKVRESRTMIEFARRAREAGEADA
jgi:galactoside O-acetyltransferase